MVASKFVDCRIQILTFPDGKILIGITVLFLIRNGHTVHLRVDCAQGQLIARTSQDQTSFADKIRTKHHFCSACYILLLHTISFFTLNTNAT